MDNLSKLPGLDLDVAQRKHLVRMADALGRPSNENTVVIKLEHPAMSCMRDNLRHWQSADYAHAELRTLLTRQPWIWHVLLTVFSVQITPFIDNCEGIPVFCNNLILKDSDDGGTVQQVLEAVTFVNHPGLTDAGAIQAEGDLQVWEKSPERLVLIKGNAKVIRSLRKILSECDRVLKCGGTPTVQSLLPILLSEKYIFSNYVVDRPLPAGLRRMSDDEYDLLRTALAHVITSEIAAWSCQQMEYARFAREARHLTPVQRWHCVAVSAMVNTWFPEEAESVFRQVMEMLRSVNEAVDAERREVDKAIKFLKRPQNYVDQLILKPRTKEEAIAALETVAGFIYTASAGDYPKILQILFTEESLMRLLGWTNGDSTRLKTLIQIMEEDAVLLVEKSEKSHNKKRNITFEERKTMRFFSFHFPDEEGWEV